jgi:RNA polymerase sigma-70 factor, ECF subfamily
MVKTAHNRHQTDAELVLLTLQNQEYYAYLMDRYTDKLSRYIRRLSNFSDEDIEDVLQNVFLKAYKNLNEFDQKLKFSSWIYRITHNEVISQFRKNRIRPQTVIAVDDVKIINKFAADIDMPRELDQKFLTREYSNFLSNLSAKYREVLILRYLEDKSYEEIADILKTSTGSVGTLISRAKQKLKKEVLQIAKQNN